MDERDERLLRAARRAGYHLLKAVLEVLSAVSVILEELGGREAPDRGDGGSEEVLHIPVE